MTAYSIEAERPLHLAEKVVVTDGMGGCGKTMLAPIMSSLPRVEIMQYAYEVEHACALHFLGRVEIDAAVALVRSFTDQRLYNSMMARDTNFRKGDLSSVFMNARPWRYFKRLVSPGDGAVMARLGTERPILHLTTHNLLNCATPLFKGLGDRLVFIRLVRHPLYMLRQNALNTHRYASDPRIFTMHHRKDGGSPVPFYAAGWEDLLLRSNPMERAIYCIEKLQQAVDREVASLTDEERQRILFVPFEPFVLDPSGYMQEICRRLDVVEDGVTRKMMKKQRVPRKKIAAGRSLPIYRQYRWEPPLEGADERKELAIRRAEAVEAASPRAIAVLDRLSAEYEERWLKGVL